MKNLQCLFGHKIFINPDSIEVVKMEKLQRGKDFYKQECRCKYCKKTFIRRVFRLVD
jgi:hypothetical protein